MTTIGTFALGGAVAAAAFAALAPRSRHAPLATRAHVALVLGALAWLAFDLLAGTLRHAYAWAHTDVSLPWPYRLAGVWAGEQGTVLVWNAVVATSLLFLRHERPARIVLLFSGALASLGILFGTFEPTSPAQLARAPGGAGLADVLVTPLMVIHPPVQFVAYGLLVVPAAYALASLWDAPKDGAWAAHAFPWARAAWLFATAGLTLGALWAYYVLSFGGYWAWDPVETSNLLPWLALTAFLHAGKQRMRGQGNGTAALLTAYGALLLVLFATFATRSGLWVSVHAFTDPTDRFEPDAAARLLAILDAHLPTRAFLGLLGALLFGGAGLFAARRLGERAWGAALVVLAGAALVAPAEVWGALFWLATRATPLGPGLGIVLAAVVGAPFVWAFLRDDAEHPRPKLDARTLMAAAIAILGIALGVLFLLNLQVVNGPDRSVFDTRVPFLALPLAALLALMLALAPLGKRGALLLAGGALLLSLAAFAYWRNVAALAAPVCLAAAMGAILRIAHAQGSSSPRALRVAGSLLLGASLLGILLWSNPPTRVAGLAIPDGASLALGILGMGASALGILGAVAAFRARGFALALAGGVAGALALGYGVGSLLALAALGIVLARRAEFRAGFLAHERVRLRETGIWLVHLAVALGLLGFAASTYAQEREVFANTPLDVIVHVAGYEIDPGDPEARIDGSKLDALTIPLALGRGGERLGEEALTFEWRESAGVYRGLLDVRRTLTEDVYVAPLAFHTPQGWVGADSAAGARVDAQSVDAVTFSVSVLPLMSLVWAAGWGMVLGMGLILVGSVRAPKGP